LQQRRRQDEEGWASATANWIIVKLAGSATNGFACGQRSWRQAIRIYRSTAPQVWIPCCRRRDGYQSKALISPANRLASLIV